MLNQYYMEETSSRRNQTEAYPAEPTTFVEKNIYEDSTTHTG